MRFAEKPPLDLPGRDRSGDDLDGLLRAYYQAKMPHPWPVCPQPPLRNVLPAVRSRWTLARSRLALAASIGLLLASLWALAGRFTASVDPGPDAPVNRTIKAERVKPYEIKESLFQDPGEGTKLLIEIFDK